MSERNSAGLLEVSDLGIGKWLRGAFSLDLRSLALMRVFFALILLFDLVDRAIDMEAFYTDEGLIPRYASLWLTNQQMNFSLHMASGELWFQAVLFALHALVLLAFLFGLRTRLSTFLVWFFTLSLHYRAYQITDNGDVAMRSLLLVSMLLPLGARWSFDSALNDNPQKNHRLHLGAENLAFFAQIFCIYLFAGYFKVANNNQEWIPRGMAVWYTLSWDHYVTPIGVWLRQFFNLTKLLTWSTVFVEMFIPPLLLLPFWPVRVAVAATMIGLHVGFGLFINLWVFPLVSIVPWIPLLFGPELWDRLEIGLKKHKGIIFYDGDCLFCRKMANLVQVFLILPNVKLQVAQEDEIARHDMEHYNSWVFRDKSGKQTVRFEAFRKIVELSPLLAWIGPLLACELVSTVGDFCYQFVSNNRKSFTFLTKSLHYAPFKFNNGPILTICSFSLTVLIFCTNIFSVLPANISSKFPQIFHQTINNLKIAQSWSVFAPIPRLEDGQYSFVGNLTTGQRQMDLINQSYTVTEPKDMSALPSMHRNHRWRKYTSEYYFPNYSDTKDKYRYHGQYLCRRWNEDHPKDPVSSFKVLFFLEKTQTNAKPTVLAVQKVVLAESIPCS